MEKQPDYMLTTYDNPYNPFIQFERWFKEDIKLGHDTCGYLAREANTSDILSDDVNEQDIVEAMDRIVKQDPTIYKKVLPSDYTIEASES